MQSNTQKINQKHLLQWCILLLPLIVGCERIIPVEKGINQATEEEIQFTNEDNITGPKEIVVFPGSDHSMELFRAGHGDEMYNLIYEFFEGSR